MPAPLRITDLPAPMAADRLQLSERERIILRHIVQHFILSADPVGSRALARRTGLSLSPASIRNVMADLEEMGLLTHPHTSAGRLPTSLGYRFYVDDLMQDEELSAAERRAIEQRIEQISPEATDILNQIGDLLGRVSRLLGVILAPDLSSGILERVEILRVAAGRLMVVVVVRAGLVRTIMLELSSPISDADIAVAVRLINERLGGMRLADIPVEAEQRLAGEGAADNAVVRLFIDFPERIFAPDPPGEVHLGPARHVFDLPEFSAPDKMRGIIELIEDRDVIVHLLRDRGEGVTVTIGDENSSGQLRDFSVITSHYLHGGSRGTLGIIGPTRMNYSRLIALVNLTARLLSERLKSR
ncbi:MAG: heat-inducible transcription repressor HrcA [Calditrichaeota bacterium]|nr:heat-inducible transcription repressor HrcA [Calditrichota bacterium]